MSEHSGTSPTPTLVKSPVVVTFRRWPWLLAVALLLGVNVWLIFARGSATPAAETKHQFWIVSHAEYSAQARYRAFLKLVELRNAEWRPAKLQGLNLGGLWLADTDLHAADFTGDNFARSTLAGARMQQCILQRTDFTEADCSHADFNGVDFYRALLVAAKFNQSGLRGAGLQEAQVRDASFAQADLSHAFLLMANCSNANFSGANLTGANLEAAILKNSNLFLTQLANANLKDADFSGANWWRAQGLSTEQLTMLEKKYAPDETAPLTMREDYATWRATSGRDEVVSKMKR